MILLLLASCDGSSSPDDVGWTVLATSQTFRDLEGVLIECDDAAIALVSDQEELERVVADELGDVDPPRVDFGSGQGVVVWSVCPKPGVYLLDIADIAATDDALDVTLGQVAVSLSADEPGRLYLIAQLDQDGFESATVGPIGDR